MENSNLSKMERNWFKINIKEIVNNCVDEDIMEKKFNEIIINNINNDKIIKYIIKILSFNIKAEQNENIKIKYYKLFLLLIKNLSKEDIIKYLTNLLLFLQENINFISIEISFELILNNLQNFKLKTFEILNGFCIHNMKQKDNKIQKKALLCYEQLIMNYNNCIENEYKYDIIKSFIDNIMINLKNDIFIEKYQLLVCLDRIINTIQDKFINFIDSTILYILNYLLINDNNIKLISLNIIYNIIKYNKEKTKEYKNIIKDNLIKVIKEGSLDINIKSKILEIFKLLDIDNSYISVNSKKEKIINKNRENYVKNNKIKSDNLKNYNNKEFKPKYVSHNNSNSNNLIKIKSNNINKIKNKNIKIEIFVKKNPNTDRKELKRIATTPLNKSKKIIDQNDKKERYFSTFANDEDYLNPIKMWYNIDNKNLTQTNDNNDLQVKEEPNLELIMNEIKKISNLQNYLEEKIISLEKSTYKKISYFNSKIDELEKKISINEINININNDNKYKVIFPSNTLNEKLIQFLNSVQINKSIYYLLDITEDEMIKIDNNIIEDVVNKLIIYLEQEIYVHESINFIKKVFTKNKMRFKLNTIKRLLSVFDKLLKNKNILNKEDSFDISLIMSSINIDKI